MTSENRKLDWDRDVVKHYVRRHAWLPAVQDQIQTSIDAGRSPKYLTFCASNAIDVFLFLREKVLRRDPETDVVLDTYFCEKEPTEFNEITRLIGAADQGFLGNFEEMILFEDDGLTMGNDIRDTTKRHRGPVIRRRLNIKERHRQLKAAAPFDVVNLDICGTFFPPKSGEESPMFRSLQTLLDWHTEASGNDQTFKSFTLFLTTHMEASIISQEALTHMKGLIDENQSEHPDFGNELCARFGTTDVDEIATDRFVEFYCMALPKLVIGLAHERGWSTEIKFSGRYRRVRESTNDTYWMLSWVGKFERFSPAQLELGCEYSRVDYAQLINETTQEPKDINDRANETRDSIKADLADVVSFRDQHHGNVRSAI